MFTPCRIICALVGSKPASCIILHMLGTISYSIRYPCLLFGCCGSPPVWEHTFNSTRRIPFGHVTRQHKHPLTAEASAFGGFRCTGEEKKGTSIDSQRSYNGGKGGGGFCRGAQMKRKQGTEIYHRGKQQAAV